MGGGKKISPFKKKLGKNQTKKKFFHPQKIIKMQILPKAFGAPLPKEKFFKGKKNGGGPWWVFSVKRWKNGKENGPFLEGPLLGKGKKGKQRKN